MIFRSLRIDSFAGLSHLELEFSPALTILSGPNEAGKSTIYHALVHTLLTSSGLTKKQFESQLARFLPLSGGDTLSCALTMSHDSKGTYTLTRSWGGKGGDRLVLPEGGEITDPKGVEETLKGFLPAKEGALRSIFFLRQNSLKQTLSELKASRETSDALGAVIRKSLFETGGLSVDRFTRLLDERWNACTNRWDFFRREPEGNRGIDNPWKSGAGSLVKVWYAWQELEEEYRRVREAEALRADLAAGFSAVETELGKLKGYLEEYKRTFEGMKKRAELEPRLEKNGLLKEKHQKALEDWTRLETEILRDKGEIERLERDCLRFSEEKQAALKAVKDREQKKRLEELKKLKTLWEEACRKPEGLPEITSEDLDSLRGEAREIARLEALLSASGVRLVFKGKDTTEVTVTLGMEHSKSISLLPGKEEVLDARGFAEIEARDFSLLAGPGDLDVAAAREELTARTARLAERLSALGVQDLSGAERAALERNALMEGCRHARAAWETALGGDDFAALSAAAAAVEEKATRNPEAVAADEAGAAAEKRMAAEVLRDREEALERLKDTYKDRRGVVKALSEALVEEEHLAGELESCPAVPGGYTDSAAFITAYGDNENRRRDLEEEWYSLRGKLLEVEQSLGDRSEEELAADCNDAREEFLREERRALRLKILREKAHEILRTLDRDTFTMFGSACAGYIHRLTDGAYKEVEVEDGYPGGLKDKRGYLKASFLSSGTLDVLSLAIRLAAADIFLRGEKGFLLLDDPMVDMDPQRRALAAVVLEDWALRNQVILFTCHPEHVTLFSDPRVINLERLV